MLAFIAADQGQVHEQACDRCRRGIGRQTRAFLQPLLRGVDFGINAGGIDQPQARLLDPVNPVEARSRAVVQINHIPRPKVALRRWQRQCQTIAGDGGLVDPAGRDPRPLAPGQAQRKFAAGDAGRGMAWMDRLGHGDLVIALWVDIADLHAALDLCLRLARHDDVRGMFRVLRQIVPRQSAQGQTVAVGKDQRAAAFRDLYPIS